MPSKIPATRKTHSSPQAAMGYAMGRGLFTLFSKSLKQILATRPSQAWFEDSVCALLGAHGSVCKHRFLPLLLEHMPALSERLGEKLLHEAIEHGADDCIPLLVKAGAVFPEGNFAYSMLVADALGEGRWPHPDLICPDILDHPTTAMAVATGVFGEPPARKRGGFHYPHLQKLATLHHGGVACFAFSQAFSKCAGDANTLWRITDNPEGLAMVRMMISKQLISPSMVIAEIERVGAVHRQKVGSMMAELGAELLNEATPQTSQPGRASVRL